MFQLVFYVPESHVEVVKNAVFAAGAGRIGDYDHCAWQVLGEGQFRPLPGSQPFLGQEGRVKVVPEMRVEMVCGDEFIEDAVEALVASHPYEEPAFHRFRVETHA